MRLVLERGGDRVAFPLEEGETYIGRKEYCEIYFPDGSLSKRHVRLVREGSSLRMFDAGSRNGTLVNGAPTDECDLRNGDVIRCGKLEFVVEGVPEGGSRRGSGDVDEFEIIESGDPGSRSRRRDKVSHMSGRSLEGSRGRGTMSSVPATPSGRVLARAVASGDVRPSVLDVLPEVPPSEELDGVGQAPQATALLRLVEGGPEQTWDLTGDTVTIGSKEENTVVISGEGVSRYHAEAVEEEGGWVVKDLGSRNGIYVEGQRVDIHELRDGDEVQIGTCRLRYEMVKGPAFGALNEVLEKLKRDPVAALKEDGRLRMGLAVIVFSLLMIVVLGVGGGGGGPSAGGPGSNPDWLREGTELLQGGKYKEAKQVFRDVVSQGRIRGAELELAKQLGRVANEWEKSNEPLSFRWDKAPGLLDSAANFEGLPEGLSGWLEEQTTWVDYNQAAYDKLREGEGIGAQAAQLHAQSKFREAVSKFGDALERYGEVYEDSLFRARADDQALAIRRRLHQMHLEEARRLMDAPQPEWRRVLRLINGHDVVHMKSTRKYTGDVLSLIKIERGTDDRGRPTTRSQPTTTLAIRTAERLVTVPLRTFLDIERSGDGWTVKLQNGQRYEGQLEVGEGAKVRVLIGGGRERDTALDNVARLERILGAIDHTETNDQKAQLRAMAEICQVNIRAEENYAEAVDIIVSRTVREYDKARDLLESVDSRARLHEDARAYMDWIEADLKVREARRAYDQGDDRRAFALLDEAIRYRVLGPEAKDSVRQRREKWGRVVRAFNRGMSLSNEGQLDLARTELNLVLELEPSQANRFNVLARTQLQHLSLLEGQDLSVKLNQGLEALERGDFPTAVTYFSEVRRDERHTQADLDQIRAAVVRANRDMRLTSNGERYIQMGREEHYLELYYIFGMLKTWLPPRHRDREKVERYYDVVRKVLGHYQEAGENR